MKLNRIFFSFSFLRCKDEIRDESEGTTAAGAQRECFCERKNSKQENLLVSLQNLVES